MKRLFILALLVLPFYAFAQNDTACDDSLTSVVERLIDKKINTNFNIDFGSSINGYFSDGKLTGTSMKLNVLRLDIKGKISDQFSFRFRQSYNKSYVKASNDNVVPALEYVNIKWHPSEDFSLTLGKQFIVIGGYEALETSLYIREFSDFNDNLSYYRLGLTGVVSLDEKHNHELQIQLANNRNGSDADLYEYGLPAGVEPTKFPFITAVCWNGYFADRALNLIYAASVAPAARNKNIYYLTCGNIYKKGPVFAYLDVMYSREDIDTQQRITRLQSSSSPVTAHNAEYLSFIAHFDYRFHPKWNAYIKGAYETSSISASDGVFEAGRYMTNWNAQASVEWLPFTKNKGIKIYAHYVYKGYELEGPAKIFAAGLPTYQRISLGLQYVIPVL